MPPLPGLTHVLGRAGDVVFLTARQQHLPPSTNQSPQAAALPSTPHVSSTVHGKLMVHETCKHTLLFTKKTSMATRLHCVAPMVLSTQLVVGTLRKREVQGKDGKDRALPQTIGGSTSTRDSSHEAWHSIEYVCTIVMRGRETGGRHTAQASGYKERQQAAGDGRLIKRAHCHARAGAAVEGRVPCLETSLQLLVQGCPNTCQRVFLRVQQSPAGCCWAQNRHCQAQWLHMLLTP